MTCIVALRTEKGVLIGGDSRVMLNGTAIDCAAPKVFRKGEFLIGSCGSVRHRELLQHKLEIPPLLPDADLDRFMAVEFSDAVRSLFKEVGVMASDEGAKPFGDVFGGAALIVVRDAIFLLAGNFSCTRQKEFAAVGSGMDFAVAALHVTRELPARVRVLKALETAAHYAEGVQGPFTILPEESR